MKRILLLTLCVLFWSVSSARADIGQITVNDQVIPDLVMQGYASHELTAEQRCSPTSDNAIRDRLIVMELIIQAAEAKGIKVSDRNQQNIDSFTKELESLGADGPNNAILKANYLRYFYKFNSHADHFRVTVPKADVFEQYKQRIKSEDPALVDVFLVRYKETYLDTEEEKKQAQALVDEGMGLNDIMDKVKPGWYDTGSTDNWSTVGRLPGYSGDGSNLKSDTVYGPLDDTIGRDMVYVAEVKMFSRIRPHRKINGSDNYALKLVRQDLARTARKNRNLALWDLADVRQDGNAIEMAKDYPDCPE